MRMVHPGMLKQMLRYLILNIHAKYIRKKRIFNNHEPHNTVLNVDLNKIIFRNNQL